MRRSDHPSRPSAITCSRFSALKTLAIPAAGAEPTASVNVSAPGAALAGFQVSINGRFWVSTEASEVSARSGQVQGGSRPRVLSIYSHGPRGRAEARLRITAKLGDFARADRGAS